jgi:GNAT superfamily N-acetyltransferase
MIKELLVNTLSPENGTYFNIENLNQWAAKVELNGKIEYIKIEDKIASYVAYYVNDERYFITMVWTDPIHRGKGLSKKIIKKLVSLTDLPIDLRVHKDNPAYWLYRNLKFEDVSVHGEEIELRRIKKIGVMQPYLFPYAGYFGLINSCDKILFYDDVNYIKKGFINRQKILVNGSPHFIRIPLVKASQNKFINEIEIFVENEINTTKILKTIEASYKKAPYFNDVYPIIEKILTREYKMLDEMVISSIASVCDYLGIDIDWERSSIAEGGTCGMDRADRLIQIAKNQGFNNYINVGPSELYTKEYFKERGINLFFNKHEVKEYEQFKKPFVSHLSCIDFLMFNPKRKCKELILSYKVI